MRTCGTECVVTAELLLVLTEAISLCVRSNVIVCPVCQQVKVGTSMRRKSNIYLDVGSLVSILEH